MAYTPIDPTVLTGVLNNQGTQATSANQATAISLAQNGTATATVVMNDFGTLATSAKQDSQVNALTSVVNNQGTLATSAKQDTGNAVLVAIMNNQGTGSAASVYDPILMNNQGTQATSAKQDTSIALAQNGTSIATVMMNDFGTLATAAGQTSQINALTSVVNNQGTGATSTKQDSQINALTSVVNNQGSLATAANQATAIALAQNGTATMTVVMNDMGTLATSAGQTSQINALTSVVNNQGTGATAVNQTVQITALSAILNAQGTESTAALTPIMNDMGTLATAATQTVMMNNQGSLATSSKQDSQINALTNVVNNQGTVATSALQTTGNSIATVIMNDFGTAATSAKQDLANTIATVVMNSQGTARPVSMFGSGTYNGVPYIYQEVQINQGRMQVDAILDDSPNLDAFSRLRVSTPAYRFDGQFTYQFNNDTWDNSSTSGSIAYDYTNRLVTLANDAGTNVSVLQSHYYVPYTPGRGQLALATFNMKVAPSSGQTKRVGYFDGNNGIFLEWDAVNGVSVNIASNTANGNQRVVQGNWNIDNLTGNGPSGFTLDLTKTQIFFVSFQALYVGRVIVGFDIDGQLIPVHAFTHANRVAYPYTQQASQPIRFEVRGTNAVGANMDCICASVISEGGQDLLELPGRAFSVNLSAGTGVTAEVPLIAIRPKQTINGVRNQGLVLPQQVTCYSRTNGARIRLIRNGTISPATWVDVSTQNSIVEWSASATSVTGGETVYAGYVGIDNPSEFNLDSSSLGRILGAYSHVLPVNPADTFVLAATSVNATATVQVGINWKEIR